MLAKALLKDKKLSEAMEAAKEAEKEYRNLSFNVGVAAVQGTLASVHYASDEKDLALEVSSASRQLFKDNGDSVGEASALKIAVDMKMAENRYYHALLLVEEMVSLYNRAGDAEGEAAAQLLASQLQVEQGDLQNAMDRSSAAAELFDQVGDNKRKAAAVLVMAKAFDGAGQMQDACQAAEAACALFQQGRDKRGQASALLCLADTFSKQSQFGPASYRLQEAAFVYRQLKDKKEEAKTLALLASTQVKLFNNMKEMPLQGWNDSDKEEAAKNAARAVELYGEVGAKSSAEAAQAMLSRAEVLNLLKRYDDAIAAAGEAQQIFEGDLGGQSNALYIIGNAHTGKGSHDAAIEALEKARELAEEHGIGLSIKRCPTRSKRLVGTSFSQRGLLRRVLALTSRSLRWTFL